MTNAGMIIIRAGVSESGMMSVCEDLWPLLLQSVAQ
eukprot:gene12509-10744_t